MLPDGDFQPNLHAVLLLIDSHAKHAFIHAVAFAVHDGVQQHLHAQQPKTVFLRVFTPCFAVLRFRPSGIIAVTTLSYRRTRILLLIQRQQLHILHALRQTDFAGKIQRFVGIHGIIHHKKHIAYLERFPDQPDFQCLIFEKILAVRRAEELFRVRQNGCTGRRQQQKEHRTDQN